MTIIETQLKLRIAIVSTDKFEIFDDQQLVSFLFMNCNCKIIQRVLQCTEVALRCVKQLYPAPKCRDYSMKAT